MAKKKIITEVDALIKRFEKIDKDEIESSHLEKIFTLLNKDEKRYFIENIAASEGFALIKVDTLDKQMKLQDFTERELWPFYNQNDNIIL